MNASPIRSDHALATRLSRYGLIPLAGSVLLFGVAWPVTKAAITAGASPLWFAVGRVGFSGLTAFTVLGLLGRLRVPTRRDLPSLASVGLISLAGFFALTHAAMAWVPAGRTAILSNATTIWIVPLSMLVLRERISPRRWLAAALGVFGVVVLMGPWAIDWSSRDMLVGHGFLLAAGLGFAVSITVVRRLPPQGTMLQLLPWCFGLATLVLVPLALVEGGGIGVWPAPSLWAMAYIGGLAGPVGTWCVMQASAKLPAMVASVGFLATPALGLFLSTWWLGEPLGTDLLLGSALILGGVACAAWPGRRR
jgi:O-acetylserine/cysteine efflux transporter